jgi:hypothetical protein
MKLLSVHVEHFRRIRIAKIDFSDGLIARLQLQANEGDGKVAHQAMVLLHKTLRSLPEQSAPRGGAE